VGQGVTPVLAAAVGRFARTTALCPAGSRVAVAVSGGSDSVALLCLLLELERDLGIDVAGLIHVNHQLRGQASEDDERFCRALAAASGRPIHVERVEVRRPEGPSRRSPEDAAREARYEALNRGRRVLAADLVALGHTRDDQAETVLLRLLRGSGPDGLGGIPPRRGAFVRPLLETGRGDLRRFLEEAGQAWVEDVTNEDRAVPRNVVRHELLPGLERVVPHAAVVLARLAGIARDEADWLSGLVNPAVDRFVHQDGGSTLVRRPLTAEATALQRRVVLAALRRAGVRQPGADEVEAVRAMLVGSEGGRDLSGGVRANRIPAGVVLTNRGVPHHVGHPAYRYSLRVPGVVAVPEASAVIGAFDQRHAPGAAPAGAIQVEVDGEALGLSVIVRNWQPGDLIRPAGLGGRKKLQDVFVDGKVPREARVRLPLVAEADGRVLWVPGLALDERVRVTSGTRAVVVLRLTKAQALPVGGPE
jgi:tRNA(Ile)-lysidine synthase